MSSFKEKSGGALNEDYMRRVEILRDHDITGAQIRAARAFLDWSVRELASETGVGTATISRYEKTKGTRVSRPGYKERIAHVFKEKGIRFVRSEDGDIGLILEIAKTRQPT